MSGLGQNVPDESSEERCAKLIRMATWLGDLGGQVFVDDGYTDEEIRVADETVKRLKGEKFGVVRGRIYWGDSVGRPAGGMTFQSEVTALQHLPPKTM